ncbi:glycosyltransferase [Gelidibacter mesophilus]|uniref:glycosyltransferase n=1 Tax=Gelidibacter mesophilus TaxID=169050 RepID=UPI00040CE35D|nr:glycosyltransferase [Gelidibacter mesophilus]
MNILISIIVPVYNVEKFIDRCIQSILNQTYKNLEIILINDGSTDESGSICDQYALKDNRVVVYHIVNGGSSIARNLGLKKSRGEYIGFVDSDDWVKPNMFNELLKFALENDLKVVETNFTTSHITEENSIPENPVGGRIEERIIALKRIISNTGFSVWRRLYHRSILKNRFFIENVLHQDVYYTIDILNEISYLGYIEIPLYVYNDQNLTSVIRSNYSIKKLNSINAGSYVVENTLQYNDEIQDLAKQYLLEFLTYHYDGLTRNNELDKAGKHRKNIRKIMKKNYDSSKFNVYPYAIINLPPIIYRIFLLTNKKRIKIQREILQVFKNV